MSNEVLDLQIYELRDRVLSIPTLERKLEILEREIQAAEDETARLSRQYESESRDVERLKEGSFSTFLFKLTGRYEDRLDKEQQEEINAKIAYDRSAERFNSLVLEKKELASRISELRSYESEYKREMEKRRRELSGNPAGSEGLRYKELENERNDAISQMTEIKEALRAAERVLSTAGKISDSLSRAEGWATFDAFTRGGIISHMAKYSHIDEAEVNFNRLSHDLRELKSELSDVRGLDISGFNEISSGQRMVDFWFDNIFTDLSVRRQVKDNAAQIGRLITSVCKAEAVLNAKLDELENKLERNTRSEEELVLSI